VNGIGYSSNNGGGLTLDGVNDYVLLKGAEKPTTPLTNGGFTFGMWFNINSWVQTKGILQITYPNALTNNNPYVLINTLSTNQLQYLVDGSYRPSLGSTLTNVNAPQYISFTISINAIGQATWKTYLNGVLRGTINTGSMTRFNSSDIYIGNGWNGFTFMNCYSTHMYNRTLSDAEVLQNYNTTKTRFGL
jgi:hypothetical protein